MLDDVVRSRIKERLSALGLSQNEVSKRAGRDRSYIRKVLDGTIQDMTVDTLERLARALETTPEFLNPAIRTDPASVSSTTRLTSASVERVRVVGICESGAWRAVEWFNDMDLGVASGAPLPELEGIRQFAFRVDDDSMDLAGLDRGDYVVCIDPREVDELETGALVVVQRMIPGGHTRELSVKELVVTDKEHLLRPRSSSAKHKPLSLPLNRDLREPNHDVSVIGVVVQEVRTRPPRLRRRPPRPTPP